MQVSLIRRGSQKGYVILQAPSSAFVAASGNAIVLDHGFGVDMPIYEVWKLFKDVLEGEAREEFREALAAFGGHQVNPLPK